MIQLVVVALCGVLCLYFLGRVFGTTVSFVTVPMYRITHWFQESSAPLPSYLRARAELIDEIDDLRERLSAKSGSDATIERLKEENDSLHSLLGVSGDTRVAAGVIARPPHLPYDTLLIDRGSDDGIAERAIVYYAGDQALGFVSKVMPQSSLVTLFSSPGVTGTAYVFGPDIFVEMHGEGGGIIRLSIPQGIEVAPGNAVVIPGIEAGIVGLVREVEVVPTDPEQRAYVTLAAPTQGVRVVGVSIRTLEPVSYEEAVTAISKWSYHDLGIAIPFPTSTPLETGGTQTTVRQ